jgi:hypothetical protein
LAKLPCSGLGWFARAGFLEINNDKFINFYQYLEYDDEKIVNVNLVNYPDPSKKHNLLKVSSRGNVKFFIATPY